MKILATSLLLTVLFLTVGFQKTPTQWKVKTDQVEIDWEFPHEAKPEVGTIGGFKAEIRFDSKDLGNSYISGSVDAASLVASNKIKTKHLTNGSGYLQSKKFPTISWKSSGIENDGEQVVAHGTLNYKDMEIPQDVEFTFNSKRRTGMFRATMDLNVKDLDISVPLKSVKNKSIAKNLRVNFSIPVKK